ncbi:MAG: serine dehydratase subunit alpha family protein [Clostridiales bacterium]|nr:serine dehydratase subunit alpha family protein [Clostridiales bacterium]
MDQKIYRNFVNILKQELVPALGCTEPIAIAYAAAKARSILGQQPDRIEVLCSGNIIKNVKGVTVPNSGGLKGIEAAAILGVLGGDADVELEVLESVTADHIARTKDLIGTDYCTCRLAEGVENLYVAAKVITRDHFVEVTIVNRHTLITKIVKDWEVIYSLDPMADKKGIAAAEEEAADRSLLSIARILEFAESVNVEDVKDVLDRQIQMNSTISDEGMKNAYGAQVGRTLLNVYGDDIKVRARARAAAGSDARMGGCSLPVVINSGSGNQGMTVSLPVIEYAKELGVSDEKLYRALCISNLISVHQKKYIGSLSAYCGAVTAASGAGAAISYLCGGDYNAICNTIVNTIANVGGIVCDGAKSSCAAKIASAVDAAILAHHLDSADHVFQSGEGIVQDDIEATIASMGHIGRVGMRSTDTEILKIMIDQKDE